MVQHRSNRPINRSRVTKIPTFTLDQTEMAEQTHLIRWTKVELIFSWIGRSINSWWILFTKTNRRSRHCRCIDTQVYHGVEDPTRQISMHRSSPCNKFNSSKADWRMGIWYHSFYLIWEASMARTTIMLDKQEGSTPISSPISIILMILHQLFQWTNFSNIISVKKAKYRTLAPLMAKTMLIQIKTNHLQFK